MKYVLKTSSVNTSGGMEPVIVDIDCANLDRMATMRKISSQVKELQDEISSLFESGFLHASDVESIDKAKLEFGSKVQALFEENAEYMCPAGAIVVDEQSANDFRYALLSLKANEFLTVDGRVVSAVEVERKEHYGTQDAIQDLLLALVDSDLDVNEILSTVRKRLCDSRASSRSTPHPG